MDIGIYSPSYRRADAVMTHEILPVTYVVAESEAEVYRGRGLEVWEVPDSVQGNVCRVRNYILDHGEERVLIVDDDIRGFGRWEEAKKVKMEGDDLIEFIEHGFALCEQIGTVLWGVNLIPDKSAYREYTPFTLRSVILGPWSGHLRNPCRYDEALSLKEDYDLSLQVLNRYRMALRFCAYFYECDQHQSAGGCASYRTIKRERDQFELLQRKWGREIVQKDEGGRHKNTQTKGGGYDLNPIVKVPIPGV